MKLHCQLDHAGNIPSFIVMTDAKQHEIRVTRKNFDLLPEMKVRWDSFPDNIGHLISPGCFRCRGGEHASVTGHVISKDRRACHTFVEQGPAGAVEKNIVGLDFKHPADVADLWKDMACTDCHTGSGASFG